MCENDEDNYLKVKEQKSFLVCPICGGKVYLKNFKSSKIICNDCGYDDYKENFINT